MPTDKLFYLSSFRFEFETLNFVNKKKILIITFFE